MSVADDQRPIHVLIDDDSIQAQRFVELLEFGTLAPLGVVLTAVLPGLRPGRR